MNSHTLDLLVTWTPYLLQGFMWNIYIAVCAVTLGSSLGAGLAWLRVHNRGVAARAAAWVSRALGAVPTLALIFYAVFVLPSEITVPGTGLSVFIPHWVKAVIGLSAALLSFTAESLVVVHRAWAKGDIDTATLFIPTWINIFLISFVASSTSSASSLVGVSELVSRCNTVIAASGTGVMVPVYIYCSLYFVVTSLLFTALIGKLKRSNFMASVHQKMSRAYVLSVQAQ